MGIEQIGVQIENPFGYDYSDLHMEAFCKVRRTAPVQLQMQHLPSLLVLLQDDRVQLC